MGNVLTGQKGRGVAVVCNGCFGNKERGKKLEIRFVLQYEGEKVIYHDINDFQ